MVNGRVVCLCGRKKQLQFIKLYRKDIETMQQRIHGCPQTETDRQTDRDTEIGNKLKFEMILKRNPFAFHLVITSN